MLREGEGCGERRCPAALAPLPALAVPPPAACPRLATRAPEPGFQLAEPGWIRELPPGLPPSGEVSADPRPISPFQVSFTFESP